MHAGEEDHAQPGWTTSRRGQDSPWKSRSEWQRTEKVRSWCGQPSDRGRLKNRTENTRPKFLTWLLLDNHVTGTGNSLVQNRPSRSTENPIRRKKPRLETDVSVGVEDVVGQLEFLERDDLSRQLVAADRRVGVHVEARRHRRVGLAGDGPRRPVVGVAVALAVDRRHVHQHRVASARLHAAETQPHRWKHSPACTHATTSTHTHIVGGEKLRTCNLEKRLTRSRCHLGWWVGWAQRAVNLIRV